MKIANLISCILLVLTAFIKFGYLSEEYDGFNFWFLMHVLNNIAMIFVLAAAETLFGPNLSKSIRTYLNFLDC